MEKHICFLKKSYNLETLFGKREQKVAKLKNRVRKNYVLKKIRPICFFLGFDRGRYLLTPRDRRSFIATSSNSNSTKRRREGLTAKEDFGFWNGRREERKHALTHDAGKIMQIFPPTYWEFAHFSFEIACTYGKCTRVPKLWKEKENWNESIEGGLWTCYRRENLNETGIRGKEGRKDLARN